MLSLSNSNSNLINVDLFLFFQVHRSSRGRRPFVFAISSEEMDGGGVGGALLCNK